MLRWLKFPVVQIALCVTVFLLASWRWGPFFMAIASPLLGVAVCVPLMNLAADLRQRSRENTWLPVHGQHYVYKGVTLRVLEDEEHRRWVNLADARRVVGVTASERSLAATYPGRCDHFGKDGAYLRDDAMVEHFAKENDPAALRFRTWVEGTIANPGRNVRKKLGIRD